MEPISETIKKRKPFRQFLEDAKDLPEIPKRKSVPVFWVKKLVSVKEWNGFYQFNSTYCFLRKEPQKGVWIGFLVVNYIPVDCEELTDEEALQLDNYRRAHNIRPFPCYSEDDDRTIKRADKDEIQLGNE